MDERTRLVIVAKLRVPILQTCLAVLPRESSRTLTLTRPARVHCLTAILTRPLKARAVIHVCRSANKIDFSFYLSDFTNADQAAISPGIVFITDTLQ